MAGVFIAIAQSTPSESVREFKVTAQKFEFSPAEINVKRGDRVRLSLTALDAQHGFRLEAFHIEQKLPKGEPVTVEFAADRPGSFPFQCSNFFGMGHGKMKGKLIVE